MTSRGGVWLAGVVVLAALLAGQIHTGTLHLQSDLLALLPAPQRDAVTAAAMQRLADAGQRRLLMAFSGADAPRRQAGAESAAMVLRESGAFTEVATHLGDWLEPDKREALQALYHRHRFQLLAPRDIAALEQSRLDRFTARAQARIYGIATGGGGRFIEDPLGLSGAYQASLAASASAPGLQVAADGSLFARSGDGRRHAVLFARTVEDPFSLSAQSGQMRALAQAKAQAQAAAPAVTIRVAGVLQHAAAASRRARTEISLIGGGSLAGILLLVLWAFRGLRPFLLSVLALAGGCLLAVVATAGLFGNLHVLTLVFGASLVGVAIDYCFHFFACRWDTPAPGPALRTVLPAISLGLLTSVLAYGSMALAPFPGLRQMAVFAAFGLVGAWLGVVLLLPAAAGQPPHAAAPLRLAQSWLARGLPRLGVYMGPRRLAWAALALLMFATGMVVACLQPDDDIRLLYNAEPALLADEREIADMLGGGTGARAIVVRGESQQAVLRREAALVAALRAADPPVARFSALTEAYPPPGVQTRTHDLLAATLYASGGPLDQLLTRLGFDAAAIAEHRADFDAARGRTLAFDAWLDSPAAHGRRFLWLGEVDGQWVSLVMLHSVRDETRLDTLLTAHGPATMLDRVARLSGLLGDYRDLATGLLAAAYALAWLLLSYVFGVRGAVSILLPPILASALVAAVFALTGWPFSLFNLFALILLLGMGADYGIFLRMAGPDGRAAAMAAVGLSAATTLLAFGLLALSATPALHSFGLTLTLGILLTFTLASVLAERPMATPVEGAG